jgi:hypothetical protein
LQFAFEHVLAFPRARVHTASPQLQVATRARRQWRRIGSDDPTPRVP